MVKWILLLGYGTALGAAVWARGGVDAEVWNWAAAGVIGLALVGEVAGMRKADRWAPGGRDRRVEWWCGGLLAVAGLQMAPLPAVVVGWISPASREIWAAAGRTGWMPVTVAPEETWGEFLRLGATLAMVVGGRRLAEMWEEKRWVAAAPVVVVAWLESVLGLAQFYFARMAGGEAGSSVGTYVNRNHFAGLLEMAAPVAAGLAAGAYARGATRHSSSWRSGVVASWWLGVAGCLVLGVVVSLSRMGFLAMLAGLGVGVLSGLGSRGEPLRGRWRLGLGVGVVAALGLGLVYLPTDELIRRFASFAQTDDISQDTRAEIWRETGGLIRDYPVLGAGLGSYVTAFLKYKTTAPDNTVDYAHNDYLQVLAEMGVVGFAAALGLVWFVFGRAWRGAHGWGWLEMGLVGALAAMALHSLVDFNLHVPANALALAWFGGMACADEEWE
jgi:O-antigen ligase